MLFPASGGNPKAIYWGRQQQQQGRKTTRHLVYTETMFFLVDLDMTVWHWRWEKSFVERWKAVSFIGSVSENRFRQRKSCAKWGSKMVPLDRPGHAVSRFWRRFLGFPKNCLVFVFDAATTWPKLCFYSGFRRDVFTGGVRNGVPKWLLKPRFRTIFGGKGSGFRPHFGGKGSET